MKKFMLLPAVLFFSSPAFAQEESMMITVNINRVCAAIVNIPYASDNFSDAEWKRFQKCVRFMRKFDNVE